MTFAHVSLVAPIDARGVILFFDYSRTALGTVRFHGVDLDWQASRRTPWTIVLAGDSALPAGTQASLTIDCVGERPQLQHRTWLAAERADNFVFELGRYGLPVAIRSVEDLASFAALDPGKDGMFAARRRQIEADGPLRHDKLFFTEFDEATSLDVPSVGSRMGEAIDGLRVELFRRVYWRASAKLRRPSPHPEPLLRPGDRAAARHETLRQWTCQVSNCMRRCYEKYYLDAARCQVDREALFLAHYRFVDRQLYQEVRVEAPGQVSPRVLGRTHGCPDSAMYFTLAEFALLAIQLDSADAAFWRRVLPAYVASSEAFRHLHGYSPRWESYHFDPGRRTISEAGRREVLGILALPPDQLESRFAEVVATALRHDFSRA